MPTPLQEVNPIIPAPPRPSAEYSIDYMNQLNRWLENMTRVLGGIIYLRGSGLYLAPESFPQTAYGLRVGEVWANDGILTWVREGDIGIDAVTATGTLGDLTVTVA